MHKFNFIFIAIITLLSYGANAETLTVLHPEISSPTMLDHGKSGQSIGDMRIWHFDAKTDKGDLVVTDWVMTTTGVIESKGIEYRITSATFSFGNTTADQIVLQGVAEYASSNAALENSVSTSRAIIGGTGKYANASGWAETDHLPDGSWQHILHLK